jgi:hypothetical protein
MPQLREQALQRYLATRLGRDVRVTGMSELGGGPARGVKEYGYGMPVRVDYDVNGDHRSAVLETITPGPFGHEHMADRAQILLWSHRTSCGLPRHVRSLDVGGFTSRGELVSAAALDEFFVLNELVEGTEYARDLEGLRDGREPASIDAARADALCDYLVEVHRVRGRNPELYTRRIRELVGHNECIAGILDSYPPDLDAITRDVLQGIEHACVRWRWKIKDRTDRLTRVHGDFHPWNILFREGTDFTVLDRARGEWGDPADDVTCLTLNYVFFSLQRSGRLEGAFADLFRRFWARYLKSSGDPHVCDVAAPFFAFRGLVMASPVWYPSLSRPVRQALIRFVRRVLDARRFDPARINDYCEV